MVEKRSKRVARVEKRDRRDGFIAHERERKNDEEKREDNARGREEKRGELRRKRRSRKICATEIFSRMREKEKREERREAKGGQKKTFLLPSHTR